MASSSSLTLSQAILSRSTIPRHGSSQQLHPSSALSIPSFSGLKSTSSSAVPSLSRRRAAAVVRLPVRASAAVETLEKTNDTELVESPSTPLRKNGGNIFLTYPSHGLLSAQTRPSLPPYSGHNQGEQAKGSLQIEDKIGRRLFLTFLAGSGTLSTALPSFGKTKKQNPYDERRLLEQNKRIQRENNVPDDFPNFVREGFTVKVVTPDYYVTRDSGLVVWDIEVGKGDCPKDGQQVTFHYIGYNESGRRIDSTYLQGSPAKVRLGTNGLIPGFEEGIKDMKPGGKRRMIIPPELGPPVGPSTFFSSKQFEVFDVELLSIQDCTRRTIGFYSDVVCG